MHNLIIPGNLSHIGVPKYCNVDASLAVVPHSCLEIGYNVDPYGQPFFPNSISVWNGLAKDITGVNTLDIFKSKLQN